jgi:hypothetical protein
MLFVEVERMHFHLPRPLHGWRAFVGEVGIIVLGVLIALGAEQLVEAVHDHRELAEARELLRAELSYDSAALRGMAEQDPCADARLALLERWAKGQVTMNTARLASMNNRPLLYTLSTTAWDVTKGSAIAARMPIKERMTYATLYDAVENEKGHVLDERRAWDLLARYAGQDRLTPEEAQSFQADLGSVRVRDDDRRFNAAPLLSELRAQGIKPDRSFHARDPRLLCRAPT